MPGLISLSNQKLNLGISRLSEHKKEIFAAVVSCVAFSALVFAVQGLTIGYQTWQTQRIGILLATFNGTVFLATIIWSLHSSQVTNQSQKLYSFSEISQIPNDFYQRYVQKNSAYPNLLQQLYSNQLNDIHFLLVDDDPKSFDRQLDILFMSDEKLLDLPYETMEKWGPGEIHLVITRLHFIEKKKKEKNSQTLNALDDLDHTNIANKYLLGLLPKMSVAKIFDQVVDKALVMDLLPLTTLEERKRAEACLSLIPNATIVDKLDIFPIEHLRVILSCFDDINFFPWKQIAKDPKKIRALFSVDSNQSKSVTTEILRKLNDDSISFLAEMLPGDCLNLLLSKQLNAKTFPWTKIISNPKQFDAFLSLKGDRAENTQRILSELDQDILDMLAIKALPFSHLVFIPKEKWKLLPWKKIADNPARLSDFAKSFDKDFLSSVDSEILAIFKDANCLISQKA